MYGASLTTTVMGYTTLTLMDQRKLNLDAPLDDKTTIMTHPPPSAASCGARRFGVLLRASKWHLRQADPPAAGEARREATMNSILVIHPYKHEGMWVFDDERVGLVREPFVSGADTIIDRMVSGIPDAEGGFTLVFSAAPFPGHDAALEWRREESNGNWYYSPELNLEGWLCPALLKYFDAPPARLYAQFKARP